MQSRDSMASELKWIEGISIGSVIEGKIQEIKDVGVVVSFEKYGDVFGFITRYQCEMIFSLSFDYFVELLLSSTNFLSLQYNVYSRGNHCGNRLTSSSRSS